MKKQMTFGLIIGNRGFFPDHLARSGREEMIKVIEDAGSGVVVLGTGDSKFGAVETREEAKKCAALFQEHRQSIDGVVVSLPNFGDERAVAETLRMAKLNVPVLIQATPDAAGKMTITDRRDSFCGKISVSNNLAQYGILYSLTRLHTVSPDSDAFRRDLEWFAGVCRVVNGLRTARIGAIGARPAAFNTVRYSEKLLEASGIDVETVDLSEILGRIGRMSNDDNAARQKLQSIKDYVPTGGVPPESLLKMAKLAAVIEAWMKETDVTVSAVQCWTAIEEYFGIVPCAVMSMMSERLMPSACEVDVTGALSMVALVLASGTPAGLADWNNNYKDAPDKCVFFHCGNWPKCMFKTASMSYLDIVGKTMGRDCSYGSVIGRAAAGPLTFARLSTDDADGEMVGYIGEGRFTNDPLRTFGSFGVVHVPGLQDLMQLVCRLGFEHHVAFCRTCVADIVEEALGHYLGWSIFRHS